LLGHFRGVALDEGELVQVEAKGRRVESLGLSFGSGGVGIAQTIEVQVGAGYVGVAFSTGIELQSGLASGQHVVVLPEKIVDNAEIVGRNVVARIGLRPSS